MNRKALFVKGRRLAAMLVMVAVPACGGAGVAPSASLEFASQTAASHQSSIEFTLILGIPQSGPNSKVKAFRISQYGSHAPPHVWNVERCATEYYCSTSIKAISGAPFVVESYDTSDGTGHPLSTSTVYQYLYSPPTIQLVLNQPIRKIGRLIVAFVPQGPRFGRPSRVALSAVALDGWAYIVGAGRYRHPVMLHVSGNMRLSTTKVESPGQPVYLSYNGGFEFATVTASTQGTPHTVKSDPATVRPFLSASERAMRPYGSPMAVAADGSVWLKTLCGLAKVLPDLRTQEFQASRSVRCPGPLTTGPDGRIWFSGGQPYGKGFMGFITPDGTYGGFQTPFGTASGFTAGSDGRLWAVVEAGTHSQVYAMTTDGVLTTASFVVPHTYYPRMAAGPDGNLWIVSSESTNKGFYIVDTSGARVTFLKHANVAPPFVNAGRYLFARIIKPTEHQVSIIGKWDANRNLVAMYQVGGIGDQLTVDRDGTLWFRINDATLGRISSSGDYCELAVPPSTADYAALSSGLVAAPDGYLYYTRGNTVGKIRIPRSP